MQTNVWRDEYLSYQLFITCIIISDTLQYDNVYIKQKSKKHWLLRHIEKLKTTKSVYYWFNLVLFSSCWLVKQNIH